MKLRNKNVIIVVLCIILVSSFSIMAVNYSRENRLTFLSKDDLIKTYNLNYSNTSVFEIPEPYYVRKCNNYNTDIKVLKRIITEIEQLKYIENIYDCSDQSAYLEWLLENNCYNTSIHVDYNIKHAWVNVHLNDNEQLDIETIAKISIDNLPIRKSGFIKYDTIYTAFNASKEIGLKQNNENKYLDDWDWWRVFTGSNYVH